MPPIIIWIPTSPKDEVFMAVVDYRSKSQHNSWGGGFGGTLGVEQESSEQKQLARPLYEIKPQIVRI